MKDGWLIMFLVSSVLLLFILIKNKLSWRWMYRFSLHLVAAAAVLYLLNFSGLVSELYIPLNPLTIGTVVALGVPGIALIAGLQYVI